MTRRNPPPNNTSANPSIPNQPSATTISLQPHQDEHLIWLLDVIAQWLEYHASDATRAELARFLDYPNARGAVLHVIDTAALWADELDRLRSQSPSRAKTTQRPEPNLAQTPEPSTGLPLHHNRTARPSRA